MIVVLCTSCGPTAHPLRFRRWRILLEQLSHRLVQILLDLLRIFSRTQSLTRGPAPHLLLLRYVIHINVERPDVDGGTGGGGGSHATVTAPAAPATIPPHVAASAVGVPLLLLTDSSLICDDEVRVITFG